MKPPAPVAPSKNRLSRRGFAALFAAAPVAMAQQQTPTPPAGAPNPNTSQQRRGTIPEVPPFEGTLSFTKQPVMPKVQPFPMTQVRVLGGPFKEAAEWNRGYMARLVEDRLIHNFRLNAGMPSSAAPLGGWEQYT